MKGLLLKIWFYTQRAIMNPEIRDKIARIISVFMPKVNHSHDPENRPILERLKVAGFSPIYGVISDKQLADIRAYISDKKMFERYDKKRTEFTLQDIPLGAHTGSYSETVLSRCPHLLEIANNAKILDIVSAFIGCKPTLSNITIWNSFPSDDGPRNAEYYHRDVDDIRFVKVFIYLSNVDEESGPHVYVEGSANTNKLVKIKRYEDVEIIEEFGEECIRVITGKAGDAFIEDTFGLHKGAVVRRGTRTVLQFEYSMFPIAGCRYRGGYTKNIEDFDPYINRLYL